MGQDKIEQGELGAFIAREAIRNLTHRYCHNVWQRAGAAMADLFTSDGYYRSGPDRVPVHGEDALRRFFAELALRPERTFPYIHNHVILLNGNEATGNCYLDMRSPVAGGIRNMTGYYDDEYVKTSGGWLFRSRRFNPDFDMVVPAQPMQR